MRTITILFIILALLIAYAVTGARSYSAPVGARVTYTPRAEIMPAPEITPAPTYTPAPAYPAPMDERRRPNDERPKATPSGGGLRCGHC